MRTQQIVPWWNGIVFRSLAAVTLMTALLGGISSLIISTQVAARVQQEAQERLGELLDTVESTASVAAFANDEQLAREVAQGLLRNSEVLRVVILSGTTELARVERSSGHDTSQPGVQRPLQSPFDRSVSIGQIHLEADWGVIFSKVQRNASSIFLMLTGQMLLVILGTAAMVFLVVVRPIKATSDRLHRFDATRGRALRAPDGHEYTEIGRLVGDINDLASRLVSTLEQERALRKQQEISQRKYHDLFDHTPSGIFVAHADGTLDSFNPAYLVLTGLCQESSPPTRHLSDPAWHDATQVLALLQRSAEQQTPASADFLLLGCDGDEHWLQIMVLPLGDGCLQGTITDITARRNEALAVRRQSLTDSLTGVANREGLLQAFATLDSDARVQLAVLLVDLNRFRQINDAIGLAAGDQVLIYVAQRLEEAGLPGDFLARLGSDEFAFVLTGMSDREELQPRIEALLTQLCEPYALQQGPVTVSASLGIALFPRDGTDMPALLRSAELALKSVRQAQPHGTSVPVYEYFDPQLLVAIEQQRQLKEEFSLAVRQDGLRPFFQPIMDLRTGRLAGAEALLRWQHAEWGFISPDIFIPLAEQMDLIGGIGRQVLEDACRELASWRRQGLDLYVSVNVSAHQIPSELTAATILETLQRHGLPTDAIALEITEGVLMDDIGVAQNWIGQLRAAGLRLFLDDFGTGYSSFAYLKRFPLDTVKIDKSFITDMIANHRDHTLVNTIITMGDSLGLNVVAEGIEDASQLALLCDMGCGYGQGYYFSRPVAAADFPATARRLNVQTEVPSLS